MAALPGWVYLVGAGPGDPGLLTLRARELLAEADVVIHDRLVDPAVLEFCRPGALLIARDGDNRPRDQERVCALMIEHARRGRRVVRLKGGDPYLFGRGGEEAQALRRAGIPFEVVPGVSAGLAVPAYAGIPLTHREHAASVAFVTGHERGGRERPAVRWAELARAVDTLVIFMGLGRLEAIVSRLLEAGRPPHTPAAVIARGTVPEQRAVYGTLADIAGRARAAGLESPALVVVGDVCALASELHRQEPRPLQGLRVLLPRTVDRPGHLAHRLRAAGAAVHPLPLEDLVRPAPSLAETLCDPARYSWLVFLGPLAARAAFAHLAAQGRDARALAPVCVAAVGPATAAELSRHGIRADLVAGGDRDSLVTALGALGPQADPVLVLGGPVPSGVADALRQAGLPALERPAFTGRDEPCSMPWPPDAVVLPSSLAAEAFAAVMPGFPRDGVARPRLVAIGPATADAARRAGLPVDAVADPPGVEGLVASLARLVPVGSARGG